MFVKLQASKLKSPTNPAGHPVASGVKVEVVELGSEGHQPIPRSPRPLCPKVGIQTPVGQIARPGKIALAGGVGKSRRDQLAIGLQDVG